MPSLQKKSKKIPEVTASSKLVAVKAHVNVDFFVVTDENLQELKECSNGTPKFDMALFLFAMAAGLVISILTTELKNRFLFAVFVSSASVSFVAGIFKYVEFIRSQKKICEILKKIRKNKCRVSE